MAGYCLHCGRPLATSRRLYCDERCKMRAHRRRRAGLSVDSYPKGARRGRVPLDERTHRERRDDLLAATQRPLTESDLRRFS